MTVSGFDHVSLPTMNVSRLLAFYRRLGFGIVGEEDWRNGERRTCAITIGDHCKMNIHPETMLAEKDAFMRGVTAEPGCGDVCVVWQGGIGRLLDLLAKAGVEPLHGPALRTGGRNQATGRGVSVYVRDPDQNLLEFISYDAGDLENPDWHRY